MCPEGRPWIFQEAREGRELPLSAADRVGIYRWLVAHMKEHFGDDAMGRRKAFYFLPWHFDFLCRYRYMLAEGGLPSQPLNCRVQATHACMPRTSRHHAPAVQGWVLLLPCGVKEELSGS